MFSWFFLGLGAFILFLAGAYLDPLYTLFAFLLAGIPLTSLILMALQVQQLRYSQDYQTTHPEKGSVFTYTLRMRNESPFRILHCKIHFLLGLEGLEGSLRDFDLELAPWEVRIFSFEISCPYRGMYQVGASALTIRDSLGITSFTLKLKPENFYVYPRLVPANAPAGFDANTSQGSGISDIGLEPDTARMSGIYEYRPGLDTRRLLRRKFLETGQVWLREHENINPPGLLIALDLRREQKLDSRVLELEDRIFESSLATILAAIKKNIPVWVRYWNHQWCTESLNTRKDLEAFIARSMQIQYAGHPGLEEWFFPKNGLQPDIQLQGMATHLFTHRWNPAWIELLTKAIPGLILHVWTDILTAPAFKSLCTEAEHFPLTIIMSGDTQGSVK